MSKPRIPNILKTLLLYTGISLIALTPILHLSDFIGKEKAVFSLIYGMLFIILSRFDDVTEIGLLGLRTKLERAIQETNATLEQVKNLAKISSSASLANTARSDWLSGIDDDKKEEIMLQTREALINLGFSNAEIDDICQDFYNCRLVEYKQAILGSTLSGLSTETLISDWKELRRHPICPALKPHELRMFLERNNLLNAHNEKRLEMYNHYYQNHKHQEFDEFKARFNWKLQ